MRPRVLTIAGSDPSGGAGVQADLATFAMWRCHGMAAISALTVQSPDRIDAVVPVAPETVAAQIARLGDDCPPRAAKSGMLHSGATAAAVAAALDGARWPLVVDPVLRATSGAALGTENLVAALLEDLLPIAALATPNRAEAATLTGIRVDTEEDAWRAAAALTERGCGAVLVKGGHFEGPCATDLLLFRDGRRVRFERPRVVGAAPHGAGCTLSAAIAAGLAHGFAVEDAVRRAGDWVHAVLAASVERGDAGRWLDRGAVAPEIGR